MPVIEGIYFNINHKIDGHVLDATHKGSVYTKDWNGGDYQKWRFEDVGNGYYTIVQKATGRVLDGNLKGSVYTKDWNGGDYQKWSQTIVDLSWYTTTDEITYAATQPPTGLNPVDIITEQTIKNSSPAKITQKIEHSITRESTFEWGLKETLAVGSSVKVDVGIPFIGSVGSEVHVELSLEAHQTWSKTVSETYTITHEVELDSKTAIKVHGYIDWADDFKTSFTLDLWVAANANTISGTVPLTVKELKEVLQASGFSGTILDDTVSNKLLVSLRGEFNGTYGMSTHFDVEEIPYSVV